MPLTAENDQLNQSIVSRNLKRLSSKTLVSELGCSSAKSELFFHWNKKKRLTKSKFEKNQQIEADEEDFEENDDA